MDIVERLRREIIWQSEVGDTLTEAADEIVRLRLAIRRLAEQAATLSVQDGSVTVTMDGTLTDAEREAIEIAIPFLPDGPYIEYDGTPRPDRRATLRSLLERTK